MQEQINTIVEVLARKDASDERHFAAIRQDVGDLGQRVSQMEQDLAALRGKYGPSLSPQSSSRTPAVRTIPLSLPAPVPAPTWAVATEPGPQAIGTVQSVDRNGVPIPILSVGARQGFRAGDRFEVYRRSNGRMELVGHLEILHANESQSLGGGASSRDVVPGDLLVANRRGGVVPTARR